MERRGAGTAADDDLAAKCRKRKRSQSDGCRLEHALGTGYGYYDARLCARLRHAIKVVKKVPVLGIGAQMPGRSGRDLLQEQEVYGWWEEPLMDGRWRADQ